MLTGKNSIVFYHAWPGNFCRPRWCPLIKIFSLPFDFKITKKDRTCSDRISDKHEPGPFKLELHKLIEIRWLMVKLHCPNTLVDSDVFIELPEGQKSILDCLKNKSVGDSIIRLYRL